jgi:hypothetical protein
MATDLKDTYSSTVSHYADRKCEAQIQNVEDKYGLSPRTLVREVKHCDEEGHEYHCKSMPDHDVDQCRLDYCKIVETRGEGRGNWHRDTHTLDPGKRNT